MTIPCPFCIIAELKDNNAALSERIWAIGMIEGSLTTRLSHEYELLKILEASLNTILERTDQCQTTNTKQH